MLTFISINHVVGLAYWYGRFHFHPNISINKSADAGWSNIQTITVFFFHIYCLPPLILTCPYYSLIPFIFIFYLPVQQINSTSTCQLWKCSCFGLVGSYSASCYDVIRLTCVAPLTVHQWLSSGQLEESLGAIPWTTTWASQIHHTNMGWKHPPISPQLAIYS